MKANKKISSAMAKKTASKWIINLAMTAVMIAISYVILYPIFAKLSISFMSKTDMYDMSVSWIPKNPTMQNFKDVFEYVDVFACFTNTTVLTVLATVIQVTTCSLVAYGFARFEFKGKRLLFLLVIFMLIVPQQTYQTSSYLQFKSFNFFGILQLFGSDWNISLINTKWPVLILSMGCAAFKNGLFIFILRQFFANLPDAIEEAAWVDGAGVFRIFRSIMLPNAIPALVTVTVFAFVWTWNDLYAAQTYMSSYPLLSTMISSLSSQMAAVFRNESSLIDYYAISTVTNAGAILVMAPIIGFFALAQKFFVEGVERTGLTGT